ncbi:MAG: transcriptional regulator [Deltaproteobacteria bacterium]|jgi:TrpR family trp operon transcriptional repressor|nr:transcriptional regulator [Deltaproteobacteria bacterium]MBN2688817.1 transcriptional regulator [Deltaproteobacteria bacterium]
MDRHLDILKVFAEIRDPGEMETFCREIFSPRELNDLALRWQLLKELHEGCSQRQIAARHRISLCKITRGSKLLKKESSFTKKILDAYYGGKD